MEGHFLPRGDTTTARAQALSDILQKRDVEAEKKRAAAVADALDRRHIIEKRSPTAARTAKAEAQATGPPDGAYKGLSPPGSSASHERHPRMPAMSPGRRTPERSGTADTGDVRAHFGEAGPAVKLGGITISQPAKLAPSVPLTPGKLLAVANAEDGDGSGADSDAATRSGAASRATKRSRRSRAKPSPGGRGRLNSVSTIVVPGQVDPKTGNMVEVPYEPQVESSVHKFRRVTANVHHVIKTMHQLDANLSNTTGEEQRDALLRMYRALLSHDASTAPRTDEDVELIMELTRDVAFFKNLAPIFHYESARVLTLKSFRSRGLSIIRQGDRGDTFYIILSGSVSVWVKSDLDMESSSVKGVLVANLSAGQSFGELALTHDEPRAATIVTDEPTDVLCLTRADYQRLLAGEMRRKIDEDVQFLHSIPVFRHLPRNTLEDLTHVLQRRIRPMGAHLWKEGQPVDRVDFLIILKRGGARVTKTLHKRAGSEQIQLCMLGNKQVLINTNSVLAMSASTRGARGAATHGLSVTATTTVETLCLSRFDFTRLVLPHKLALEDMMRESVRVPSSKAFAQLVKDSRSWERYKKTVVSAVVGAREEAPPPGAARVSAKVPVLKGLEEGPRQRGRRQAREALETLSDKFDEVAVGPKQRPKRGPTAERLREQEARRRAAERAAAAAAAEAKALEEAGADDGGGAPAAAAAAGDGSTIKGLTVDTSATPGGGRSRGPSAASSPSRRSVADQRSDSFFHRGQRAIRKFASLKCSVDELREDTFLSHLNEMIAGIRTVPVVNLDDSESVLQSPTMRKASRRRMGSMASAGSRGSMMSILPTPHRRRRAQSQLGAVPEGVVSPTAQTMRASCGRPPRSSAPPTGSRSAQSIGAGSIARGRVAARKSVASSGGVTMRSSAVHRVPADALPSSNDMLGFKQGRAVFEAHCSGLLSGNVRYEGRFGNMQVSPLDEARAMTFWSNQYHYSKRSDRGSSLVKHPWESQPARVRSGSASSADSGSRPSTKEAAGARGGMGMLASTTDTPAEQRASMGNRGGSEQHHDKSHNKSKHKHSRKHKHKHKHKRSPSKSIESKASAENRSPVQKALAAARRTSTTKTSHLKKLGGPSLAGTTAEVHRSHVATKRESPRATGAGESTTSVSPTVRKRRGRRSLALPTIPSTAAVEDEDSDGAAAALAEIARTNAVEPNAKTLSHDKDVQQGTLSLGGRGGGRAHDGSGLAGPRAPLSTRSAKQGFTFSERAARVQHSRKSTAKSATTRSATGKPTKPTFF